MDRNYLKGVYNDTKEKCQTGKYHKININPSVKYNHKELAKIDMKPKFDKTTITIINEDTLVACQNALYTDNKAKICALNMTSAYLPGGGVERGSTAQEECLFRRTNYFLTLKNNFYPIRDGDNVFSPNVSIVKDINNNDINIENVINVSFIATSAVKYPDLKQNGTFYPKDKILTEKIIDNIFRSAYLNDKDTLILGALGCGAYGNPPAEIIDMYNKCLKKYDKCFKTIIFAVYSKKDKNYDLFSKYISV